VFVPFLSVSSSRHQTIKRTQSVKDKVFRLMCSSHQNVTVACEIFWVKDLSLLYPIINVTSLERFISRYSNERHRYFGISFTLTPTSG
jgi:hypothetical protein